jgi:hypothetical protein
MNSNIYHKILVGLPPSVQPTRANPTYLVSVLQKVCNSSIIGILTLQRGNEVKIGCIYDI